MSRGTGFLETMIDFENILPTIIDNPNTFNIIEGSLNSAWNLFPLLEQINDDIDDIFIGQIIIIEKYIIPKYKEFLQDPEKTAKEKQVIKSQIRMLMSMQLDPCFKYLENLLLFEDFFSDGDLQSYLAYNIFIKLRFFNNNDTYLPYIQFEDSVFPNLFLQQDSEQLKTSIKDMFKSYKYTKILLIDNNTIIELFPNEFTETELADIRVYITEIGFPQGKILLMKTNFFDLLNDDFSYRKLLALIVLVTRLDYSAINYSSEFGKINIYKKFIEILTDKQTRDLMDEMDNFRAETRLNKNVQRDMTADNTAKAALKTRLEASGIQEGMVAEEPIEDINYVGLLPSIDTFADVYITSDEIKDNLMAFFRFDINDIDTLKDCVDFLLKIIDGTFMKNIFERENLNDKYNYDIERIRTRTMKYLNIDDDTIRSLQIFNKLIQEEVGPVGAPGNAPVPGGASSAPVPGGASSAPSAPGAPGASGGAPSASSAPVPGGGVSVTNVAVPRVPSGGDPLEEERNIAASSGPVTPARSSISSLSAATGEDENEGDSNEEEVVSESKIGGPGSSQELQDMSLIRQLPELRKRQQEDEQADEFEREIEAQKANPKKPQRRGQRGGARPQGPIIYELPSFYILNAMDDNEYDIMMKNVYDNERVCKIIQEKYIDDNIGDNTFIKPYFKEENRDVNELMTYLNDIGPKIIEENELDWRRNFQTGGNKTRSRSRSRSRRRKANKRMTKSKRGTKKILINIIE